MRFIVSRNVVKLVLLQPNRTVVANFVPGSFDLFRRNHWQLLAEPLLKTLCWEIVLLLVVIA